MAGQRGIFARGTGLAPLLARVTVLFGMTAVAFAAPVPMPLETSLRKALERNPSIRAASKRWKAALRLEDQAGSARGPSVVLRDTYDKTTRQFNQLFFIPDINHVANAELTQSLYNGGQLSAAEEKARHDAEQARWLYVETRRSVVEQVVRAYLDWLQQEELNGFYRKAIERDQKLVSEIAVRVEAGKALEAERLQARIRVLDDQRNLLEGTNLASLARSKLLVLMDMPTDSKILFSRDVSFLKTLPGLQAPGAGQNASIEASRAAASAAEAQLEQAEGASLPTVNLAIRGTHFFEGLQFSSADPDFVNTVIVFEYPLFDSGSRDDQEEAARESLAASEAELRNQELQIELERKQAELDLTVATRRIDIARQKQDAANETLRVAKERYDAGTVLLSEVLEEVANTELAATEGITARFDAYRAKLTLLRLQGLLADTGLMGFAEVGAEAAVDGKVPEDVTEDEPVEPSRKQALGRAASVAASTLRGRVPRPR